MTTAPSPSLPGKPAPLGASWDGAGVNFAVHSDAATTVTLAVFDDGGVEHPVLLEARSGSVHHAYVPGLGPGTRYGLRVDGPWAPWDGKWCNPAKLLIDPYAHAVDGEVTWHPSVFAFRGDDPNAADTEDSAPHVPRSLVVDHSFDWGDDTAPQQRWSDTVIYETHVRSLTKLHPDVPAHLRGTYLGMVEPPVIDHLLGLGITAVELMLVTEFVHDRALVRRGLRNLWGYQPIAYLAPHHGYRADPAPGSQVRELKEAVRRFHQAGIEVILDVVYNHTGETHHLGPSLGMRGVDNAAYYRLDPHDRRRYVDLSGTGNSTNHDHPATLRLVADSMRHWVSAYHVDGFRFDLASVLGRTGPGEGAFDAGAAFFALVAQDPVLNTTKLIAEPWDVGAGGYRLGGYPARWREWNDRFRGDVRDYWRGAPGSIGALAERVAGSSDVFAGSRRPATTSVNYVTAHDGFTLRDLVSYDFKHNHANGEHNRDGSDDNRSWNSGSEGHSDIPDVLALRRRRARSLLATLMVSQGVPMLLGGDELWRTQRGNNNAFAQDNEVSWYDWDDADPDHLAFVRRLVQLRRRHPVFRRTAWLTGAPPAVTGLEDIEWFTPDGREMAPNDWRTAFARSVAFFLNGHALVTKAPDGSVPVDDSFVVMCNAGDDALEFILPHGLGRNRWVVEVDTAVDGEPAEQWFDAGDRLTVESFGMLVLRQPRAG